MAELLHRIGVFAARRGWLVVGAWVVLLAIAGVAFGFGFKGLKPSFEVPSTPASKVVSELQAKLPTYSGATGTVVYHTTNGAAMTDAQRAAIAGLLAGAGKLDDVATVVDPFASEQQRAAQAQQIADGRAQIAGARQQISDGQAKVASGLSQLDAAQQQLEGARAQAVAAGYPTEQIDAQLQALAAQRAQLTGQRQQLASSLTELNARSEQLETGAQLLDLSKNVRLVSEDGSTALVNVAFTKTRMEVPDSAKRGVMDYFRNHPVDGVEVSFSADISQEVPEIIGVGEIGGVVVAGIVLLVALGSLLASIFPIVTAVAGVAIGTMSTLAFSGVVDMTSVTPVFGVMLGLAVGIDYALFIINRHRRQLLRGFEVVESIGLANGTSGNAVVFAGSTVAVALLALNITGIPFLGVMGNVGAVSIAIAVLSAVTLIPALLGFAGMRALGRKAREQVAAKHAEHAEAEPAVAVHPIGTPRAIVTIVASLLVLLTLALPVTSMRLGLPDGSSEPASSTAHRAFEITEEKFGAGANGPLVVTAKPAQAVAEADLVATQLKVAKVLAAQPDVAAVAPIATSSDRQLLAFQVLPKQGPTSVSTEKLVRALRALPPVDGTIQLGVAGQAAIDIDISERLAAALPLYIGLVVGLSFLIMVIVFRSLLVPLVATAGFVFSLLASLGTLTAIFQWGWLGWLFGVATPGPLLSFLPVILVGILFGLAMDYQLFLASGMREAYVHGAEPKLAVARGYRAARRVVIAAALIMTVVFGGFVTSPSALIKPLGLGLTLGVVLDAFVVRLLLMPSVMTLLGKAAWWLPRWLDKILPNVDVEGAALERRHPAH